MKNDYWTLYKKLTTLPMFNRFLKEIDVSPTRDIIIKYNICDENEELPDISPSSEFSESDAMAILDFLNNHTFINQINRTILKYYLDVNEYSEMENWISKILHTKAFVSITEKLCTISAPNLKNRNYLYLLVDKLGLYPNEWEINMLNPSLYIFIGRFLSNHNKMRRLNYKLRYEV